MRKIGKIKTRTKILVALLLCIFASAFVNANQPLDVVKKIELNTKDDLRLDQTYTLNVDYQIDDHLKKDEYFTIDLAKELKVEDQNQDIIFDDEKIAAYTIKDNHLKWTYLSDDSSRLLNYTDQISLEVKAIAISKDENLTLKYNQKDYILKQKVIEKSNDHILTEGSAKDDTKANNDQQALKEKANSNQAKVDNNKSMKNKSSLAKASTTSTRVCDNTTNKDITSLEGNSSLFDSQDQAGNSAKTIFNEVSVIDNENKNIHQSLINIDEKLDIEYSFQLNRLLTQNINECDYFQFKLPKEFKVNNAPLKGFITDENDIDTVYGEYTVLADGSVVIKFLDVVNTTNNLKGKMKFSVFINQKEIPAPGPIEIEVPFVYETPKISTEIKVEDEQSLSKKHVSQSALAEIVDNKGVITWELVVNKKGFAMHDGKISDLLMNGLSFNGNYTVKRYVVKEDRSGIDKTIEAVDVTNSVSATTEGQLLTFDLPDVEHGDNYSYSIVFETIADFDILRPDRPAYNGSTPVVKINNSATLNSKEFSDVKASTTTSFTANHSVVKKVNDTYENNGFKPLEPSAENKYSNGVVAWYMDFEYEGIEFFNGSYTGTDGVKYHYSRVIDKMNGMDYLCDENGVAIETKEQLKAFIEKQFFADEKNVGKSVDVKYTPGKDGKDGAFTIIFEDGISDNFRINYYSLVKDQAKVANKISYFGKEKTTNYTNPSYSSVVKTYKKDNEGRPVGENNNQVTWSIELNKENIYLDKWQLQDTLSNNKLVINSSTNKPEIKVYEIKKGTKEQILVNTNNYLVDYNQDLQSFEINYNHASDSRFIVEVIAEFEKGPSQTVKNDVKYLYQSNNVSWQGQSNASFESNPKVKEQLTGTKHGDYYYDKETAQDKIEWTAKINTGKATLDYKAIIFDHITQGQTFDTSVEPKLYDEAGNLIQLEKEGNFAKFSWRYYPPGNGIDLKGNGGESPRALYVGSASNTNGYLVVGCLPIESNETYTLKFSTIINKTDNTDYPKVEKATNTIQFKDSYNKAMKEEGLASFTRDAQYVQKQEIMHDTSSNIVKYEVILNKAKDKLRNVVIEDSRWFNVRLQPDSIKVYDSENNLIDSNSGLYTIETTAQQLFIKFKEINDTYKIQYQGVMYKSRSSLPDKDGNHQVINMIKISGDEIKEDGYGSTSIFEADIEHSASASDSESSMIIEKVDQNNQQIKLKDAVFTLYHAKAHLEEDGTYTLSKDVKGNILLQDKQPVIIKDQKTDINGQIKFNKLNLGAYILVEEKAPENYHFNDDNYQNFIFKDEILQGQVIIVDKEVKSDDLTNIPVHVIENYQTDFQTYKVTKRWNDNNNQDGIRVNSIDVELYQNGSLYDTITLNQDNNFTYNWSKLPTKTDSNQDAVYTVKEVNVPTDYKDTYDYQDQDYDAIITNTHIPSLTSITGQKYWDDSNNKYQTRPENIIVELHNQYGLVTSQSIDASEGWSYEFNGLAEYKDGQKLNYFVKEQVLNHYDTTYINNSNDIKNTLKKTSKDVIKIWNDATNQDNYQPESILVQLLQNGNKLKDPVQLDNANGWSYHWDDLPQFDEKGSEYLYKVIEVSDFDNYSVDYVETKALTKIINTHVPDKISINGSKTWLDNSDYYLTRPDSVIVDLYLDDKAIDNQVITPDKQWSYSFTNLDKYTNGKLNNYSVKEREVIGYTSTTEGNNLKNSLKTKELEVVKEWNDKNNQDGLRPTSITVELLLDNSVVDEKVLDTDNNFTYLWQNLPKYNKAGKLANYTVREKGSITPYQAKIEYDEVGNAKITNSYTPKVVNINGEKIWQDNKNKYQMRPDRIIVELHVNNKKIDEKIVDASTNWQYNFENKPMYDNGVKIEYKVKEVVPNGYLMSQDGYNLINTQTTTKKSVIKKWNDDNNRDGKRASSVEIELYANEAVLETITLNEDNNWTKEYTDLATHDKTGKEITYSFKEKTKVEHYTTTQSSDQKGLTTITNTYVPEKTTLSGTKHWLDNENKYQTRPDHIIVELYANKELKTSQKVSASTNWKYEFKDLFVYENGQEIEYEVKEKAVNGYQLVSSDNKLDFTNQLEVVNKSVVKVWQDNNDLSTRPESIKVRLLQNDIEFLSVELNIENNYRFTWNDLPKYTVNGELATYKVLEDLTFEDYTPSYSVDENDADIMIITNTKTVTNEITKEYYVKKVWQDFENQFNKRPESIQVQLYNHEDKYLDSIELSEKNNWEFTYKKLPAFIDGVETSFSVKEIDEFENYRVSYSKENGSTIITNRYLLPSTSGDQDKDKDPSKPSDPTNPNKPGTPTNPNETKPTQEAEKVNNTKKTTQTKTNTKDKEVTMQNYYQQLPKTGYNLSIIISFIMASILSYLKILQLNKK